MIIGFCGPIGAGKTTAALHLVEAHGFDRVRFAGPLKAMLKALGLTDRELDGDLKESPCALLGGQTPRWALQALGTEWGRMLIHADLWINAWRAASKPYLNVVADDVRFPNEVAAIHSMGGRVYRVVRSSVEDRAGSHASEGNKLDCDGYVINNGSLADLGGEIDRLLLKL